MKAKRTMINVRADRAEQAKQIADKEGVPLTELLELMISERAVKTSTPLPGLVVETTANHTQIVFSFSSADDAEMIPVTRLTPAEAIKLAKALEAATERPCRLADPIDSSIDPVSFLVGRQSVAVTIDSIENGKTERRKTVSILMAIEIAKWLRAVVKDADRLTTTRAAS